MPYAHSAKEFTKLKTVSITKGALRLFPKQLGLDLHTYPSMIDTLVDLDLSFNNLEKLPDEICLLVQLRKFRAEQNHINRLPDGFPALCKLEKCYLNDNDLHELPVDMANMVNLRVRRSRGFLPWYWELSMQALPLLFVKPVSVCFSRLRGIGRGRRAARVQNRVRAPELSPSQVWPIIWRCFQSVPAQTVLTLILTRFFSMNVSRRRSPMAVIGQHPSRCFVCTTIASSGSPTI